MAVSTSNKSTSSRNTSSRNTASKSTAAKSANKTKSANTARETSSQKVGGVKTDVKAAATGDTAKVDTKDKVSIQSGDQNPYSDLAPFSETVKAETWTKDRTPAEGKVSRDDHLAGMLQNRGFSNKEIYAKDKDGKTLIDRVAEQNNLKNPNIIQDGGSYVIPSKHEPKSARTEQLASALAESFDIPVEAEAEARASVDKAEKVETNNKAKAEATSVKSDAKAQAKAETVVGEADKVKAENKAEAKALAPEGVAQADAHTRTEVGKAGEVKSDNTSVAHALGKDPKAVATAETLVGSADRVRAKQSLEAAAFGDNKAAGALAESDVAAKDVTDLSVEERIEADQDGVEVDQAVALEQQGGAAAKLEAEAKGPEAVVRQEIDLAGGGPALGTTVAEGTEVDQRVTNHEAGVGPFSVPRENDPISAANMVSAGREVSAQEAKGVVEADLSAHGSELAMQNSDAVKASYSGADVGRLNAIHEGRDGAVDVSGTADSVYFRDRAHVGMTANLPTGNVISGNIATGDARIDVAQSERASLQMAGTAGDDRHEVMLPTTGEGERNRVVSNLGDGRDFFVSRHGDADLSVTKTDGEMNLAVGGGDGGATAAANHLYDAGDATMRGRVDLTDVAESTVRIRAGEGPHDVNFRAGRGDNDTIVFELTGDQEMPNIDHSGFENVIVMRDGKVVNQ